MTHALQGIVCFLSGLQALLRETALRAILWRMLGVLLMLMVVCMGGVFWLMETLVSLYVPVADTWYMDVLNTLIVWPLVVLLSLLIGVVVYVALAGIAVSPWLDELAARAELPPNIPKDITWWHSIIQSLYHAAMPLLQLLPFAIMALPCLFIPVVGVPLASAVWGYGGLRFLAFELLDTPASRRNLLWPQRQQHIQHHQGFYLGIAGATSLMLMVPILNLLAVPAAVVGLSRQMNGHWVS